MKSLMYLRKEQRGSVAGEERNVAGMELQEMKSNR